MGAPLTTALTTAQGPTAKKNPPAETRCMSGDSGPLLPPMPPPSLSPPSEDSFCRSGALLLVLRRTSIGRWPPPLPDPSDGTAALPAKYKPGQSLYWSHDQCTWSLGKCWSGYAEWQQMHHNTHQQRLRLGRRPSARGHCAPTSAHPRGRPPTACIYTAQITTLHCGDRSSEVDVEAVSSVKTSHGLPKVPSSCKARSPETQAHRMTNGHIAHTQRQMPPTAHAPAHILLTSQAETKTLCV